MSNLIENKTVWFDMLFRGTFGLLLIQNILLVFALFFDQEGSDLLNYALMIDLLGFTLIIIIALIMAIIVKKDPILWLVVAGGSLLFIMGSLAWRPVLEIIPENALSDFCNDIILTNTQITATDEFLEKIAELLNAIIMSNFGLCAFSIGLAFAIPDNRIKLPMVIYGIGNVALTLSLFGILFKPLFSLPFILIAFGTIVTNPVYDLLQRKIPQRIMYEPRMGQ